MFAATKRQESVFYSEDKLALSRCSKLTACRLRHANELFPWLDQFFMIRDAPVGNACGVYSTSRPYLFPRW